MGVARMHGLGVTEVDKSARVDTVVDKVEAKMSTCDTLSDLGKHSGVDKVDRILPRYFVRGRRGW